MDYEEFFSFPEVNISITGAGYTVVVIGVDKDGASTVDRYWVDRSELSPVLRKLIDIAAHKGELQR